MYHRDVMETCILKMDPPYGEDGEYIEELELDIWLASSDLFICFLQSLVAHCSLVAAQGPFEPLRALCYPETDVFIMVYDTSDQVLSSHESFFSPHRLCRPHWKT